MCPMKKFIFFLLLIISNHLYSQNKSSNIFIKEDDYYKRISTKYNLLLNEWGSPDKTDYNSYDDTHIATYNENGKYGDYAFLSKNNVIYKVTHLAQCAIEETTSELYNKYSNAFEEDGYNSEILSNEGFYTKAMKFSKNGIIVTHYLFPMWENGKYSKKNLLSISTTITKE